MAIKHKDMRKIGFLVLITIFIPSKSYSQLLSEQELNQRKLIELNETIQEEGKKENHHLVEQSMDSMIELMIQMGIPEEIITERAHLRIRYSLSVNRLASARKAALSWLNDQPEDIQVQNLLGTIAIKMIRSDEARKALQMVYESNPKNEQNLLRYLKFLIEAGDHEEAFQIIEPIKEDCKNPNILVEIIKCFIKFNRADEALQFIDRLDTLNPKHPYTAFARGKALMDLNEIENSIELFSAIERTNPYWADAKQNMGICQSNLKQFEKAAYTYVEILMNYPYDTKTMSLLAQALARLRKREGFQVVQSIMQKTDKIALPKSEASLRWSQGDVAEHARLSSNSFNRIGQYRNSENLFLQACSIVPESTSAHYNLADFYIQSHQSCRAVPILKKLLDTSSKSDRTRVKQLLTQAYLRQGKVESADELLSNESIGQNSQWVTIGSYYLEIIGDATKAISYLFQCGSLTDDACAILARAYVKRNDIGKAWEYFQQLPSDYDHEMTQLSKAECLAKMGEVDEAEALFKATIENNPNIPNLQTISARSAIAKAKQASNAEQLASQSQMIKIKMPNIRNNVMQAHRTGWPNSIPILLELSQLYEEIDEREIALEYAQLALEGDQSRLENRERVIELMPLPDYVFQRLSQIRIARSYGNDQKIYKKEIQESLNHIELSYQESL